MDSVQDNELDKSISIYVIFAFCCFQNIYERDDNDNNDDDKNNNDKYWELNQAHCCNCMQNIRCNKMPNSKRFIEEVVECIWPRVIWVRDSLD